MARPFGRITRELLAERTRWMPWLSVFMCCGSAAYFMPRFEPALIPALSTTAALTISLLLAWRRAALRAILGTALMASLGFTITAIAARDAPAVPALPRRAVEINADIQAIEILPGRNTTDHARRVVLSASRFENGVVRGMPPLARLLRVRLRDDDHTDVTPGDAVHVRAMLRPVAPPSLPMDLDRQRDAWFSGLGGSGYALGTIEIITKRRAHSHVGQRLREQIARRLTNELPGDRGAIAATILTGASSSLTDALRRDFAAAGLSHLLAVAGLHLGIVMLLIMGMVRRGLALWEYAALRWPCKQIAVICALAAGIVYVMITGDHLPALRSLSMAGLAALAILTARRPASMRALAVAAMILVVQAPSSVLDVSFQMSFAAVMALIAGYEVCRAPLSRLTGEGIWYRKLATHILALALTSLLAGTATLPLSIAHFGTLQPYFIIANLIAVPLMALWVMPLGLASLILMPLSWEPISLHLMGPGIGLIIALAHRIAAIPAATITVPATPWWGLALFILGLCWLCLWSRPWRLLALAPIIAGVVSPWIMPQPVALIAPDAGVMGLRIAQNLYVGQQTGTDRTVITDWERILAMPHQTLENPTHTIPSSRNQSPDLQCDALSCLIQIHGHTIILRPHDRSDGQTPIEPDQCARAALVISATPIRDSCPGVPFVDRFSVWRDGAISVWEPRSGLTILSDRQWRGARLWVATGRDHGIPNLPMARSE